MDINFYFTAAANISHHKSRMREMHRATNYGNNRL